MTTKLTIENLNYKNVKQPIKEWSKEEAVKLAIFSAELVIDLYDGDSDAPREAIQAAKNWLKNPTDRAAAAAAHAARVARVAADADLTSHAAADAADLAANAAAAFAAYAAADAADLAANAAAAFAAYAAYAAADAADLAADAANAANAAYATNADNAAHAARVAADAAAYDNYEVKQKIADYINNKNDGLSAKALYESKEPEQVEWKRGDHCVYSHDDNTKCNAMVIGWHPEHPVLVIENSAGYLLKATLEEIEKPETTEQKKERELLEAAYDLYVCWYDTEHEILTFDEFKDEKDWAEDWIRIVEKTGYRKPE